MKILVLYDYPPAPGGLATQGDLLYQGLLAIGVDARAANLRSSLEKEWYYRWFKPDAVVGVGCPGRRGRRKRRQPWRPFPGVRRTHG